MPESINPPVRTPYINPETKTISLPWVLWFKAIETRTISATGTYLSDTHSNRVNYATAGLLAGAIFFETDRGVFYIWNGNAWMYDSGTMLVAQAGLPGDLGINDAGFLANVTDFSHLLRWTGAAWSWAPGEAGSGEVKPFLVDPTGTGWHLCDGSTVNYLKSDGTTAAITLPDYTTAAYLKLGKAAVVGPTAASGLSANAPTGVTNQNAATGITVPAHSGAASTAGAGAAIEVFANVGDLAHTVTDPQHTHAVTDPQHAHGPGTLELRNTQLKAWFRQ